MSKFASKKYLKLLQEFHQGNEWWGTDTAHLAYIMLFLQKYNSRRESKVLDYGCGKGTLNAALSYAYDITGYDIAVEEYSALPKTHGILVCTDVLEHVEDTHIHDVLKHIARVGYTVLLIISVVPAEAVLSDGQNAHINLKTREEWLSILDKYFSFNTIERGASTLKYVGTSKLIKAPKVKSSPKKSWKK